MTEVQRQEQPTPIAIRLITSFERPERASRLDSEVDCQERPSWLFGCSVGHGFLARLVGPFGTDERAARLAQRSLVQTAGVNRAEWKWASRLGSRMGKGFGMFDGRSGPNRLDP